MRIALIGHGAIARYVLQALTPDEEASVAGVVVRPRRVLETTEQAGGRFEAVASIAGLGEPGPALVVECAGHGGLGEHGLAALERGIDLLVVSVGALADRALFERLRSAGEASGATMSIVPGAVGGIDALAAARQGGLSAVRYTGRKPPAAWKGSPGEAVADLDNLRQPTELFAGPAGEAARLYPKNANVAATVALAGLGFEKTQVRLLADPGAQGNHHRIEAEGAFGSFAIEIAGKPLPDNPRTSSLTAYSVLRAIRNRAGAIAI
ncbi:MAG: aspartate dehydrogenase [Alphaproteobacteria bacterium]